MQTGLPTFAHCSGACAIASPAPGGAWHVSTCSSWCCLGKSWDTENEEAMESSSNSQGKSRRLRNVCKFVGQWKLNCSYSSPTFSKSTHESSIAFLRGTGGLFIYIFKFGIFSIVPIKLLLREGGEFQLNFVWTGCGSEKITLSCEYLSFSICKTKYFILIW